MTRAHLSSVNAASNKSRLGGLASKLALPSQRGAETGKKMIEDVTSDAKSRMAKSVEALKNELTKLRTGRAHTSLLEHITVPYYGSDVPLNQVASISVGDARTLVVQPWGKKHRSRGRKSYHEIVILASIL